MATAEELKQKFLAGKAAAVERAKPKTLISFVTDAGLEPNTKQLTNGLQLAFHFKDMIACLNDSLLPTNYQVINNTKIEFGKALWDLTQGSQEIDYLRAEAIAELLRKQLFPQYTQLFYRHLIMFHMGFDPFKELNEAKANTAEVLKVLSK